MKIIKTSQRDPSEFDSSEREWVYNGLDCCITFEVLDAILPQLDEHTQGTYDFSRALQGPVLEMRLRGVLVDETRRAAAIDDLYDQIEVLERQLDRIVLEGVGLQSFNWRSNADLQHLFYEKLHIPTLRKDGKLSVDRSTLEKMDEYLIARPIVRHLFLMRDLGKKITTLKTGMDPDGRIRTSYNIAGTSTGRFSSSFSEFGTGGNLQNIEESLRAIFIADPGYKFAKFDAKSGESFIVGAIEWNLFGDARYLDACRSGDPHTAVARICWPNLGWTGDLKADKIIAEQPYYRHYTHRFMCKKLGHGSNYAGQAETLATQSRLPLEIVRNFQPIYFKAFPAHLQWQAWVDAELRRKGRLISFMGRKRQFWGRRNDHKTLREAIAYDPQSSLSDIVNRALLRIWHNRTAIVMFQDHDALTFMYPEDREDEVVPLLAAALPEAIPLARGQELIIPYDCKVGWNKGDWSEDNPDGLMDWTGHDPRRRTPQVHWLDRKRGAA